jgi:ABC-type proline/glycine betaine transport system ATPase subunit
VVAPTGSVSQSTSKVLCDLCGELRIMPAISVSHLAREFTTNYGAGKTTTLKMLSRVLHRPSSIETQRLDKEHKIRKHEISMKLT